MGCKPIDLSTILESLSLQHFTDQGFPTVSLRSTISACHTHTDGTAVVCVTMPSGDVEHWRVEAEESEIRRHQIQCHMDPK